MERNMRTVYVGSWSMRFGEKALGVGIYDWDEATGALRLRGRALEDMSVDALALDRRRGVLYGAGERKGRFGLRAGGGGAVVALRIDPESGALTELSCQPTFAPGPSGAALDAEGDFLLVTNHSGGDPVTKAVKDASGAYRLCCVYDDSPTGLYPIGADGAVLPACDLYLHEGSGPKPPQKNAHPHHVQASPDGRLFCVCDKGADRVWMFAIDREARRLVPCRAGGVKAPAGSAPRHCAFHPTLPYLFVNHELEPLLAVYRYDAEGQLTLLSRIRVLPEGFHLPETPTAPGMPPRKAEQSDLCVHPGGKFVYDYIRGVNEVKAYALDAGAGTLTLLQSVTVEKGTFGRGCMLSPDGRFLYVMGTLDDCITGFAVQPDGTLTECGRWEEQPYPCCMAFSD